MARKNIHPVTNLIQKPGRFTNREISWLAFTRRILEEANNPSYPLLERARFLAISASNLTEFFMVRVAGLNRQIQRKEKKISQDNQSPDQQLDKIYIHAKEILSDQEQCLNDLLGDLKDEGIEIKTCESLGNKDKKWLEGYFLENIFPALSPLLVTPAQPFPYLPNLGLAIVMELEHASSKETTNVLIPFPSKIERFISIPAGDSLCFVLLEDVIEYFEQKLFPDSKVLSRGVIGITRDSDLEVDDEAEDLVQHFEEIVKERKRGSVIRLKMQDGISEPLQNLVIQGMDVPRKNVLVMKGIVGLVDIEELCDIDRPDLKFAPFEARFPERIHDFGGDCFAAISAKDIVVHHPYESFDVVVKFLEQAAHDPDVVAIKQTLYRTSSESPIVKALIAAAEAGKSVTVVVELKARFDEEANLRWARDLERVGAQVIFGFVELKTHAKVSQVIRRVKGKLCSYVHFGTGNYHPVTAKTYSDLSFFTCNPDLCSDATLFFNYLTGHAMPKKFNKIIMAPFNLRSTILELIEKEIEFAREGKPAMVWAKMNALIDTKIIDALYRASAEGVSIHLIVRGICTLRPGVKGLSENIRVKSIVGRFLEHSRIYCFGNGAELPHGNAKVYISSADCMERNCDRRIEIMVPVENVTVQQQVLKQIMVANMEDERCSWFLQGDGSYNRAEFTDASFSAHEYFINNPSLSGRGKALEEEVQSNIESLHLLNPRKNEDE